MIPVPTQEKEVTEIVEQLAEVFREQLSDLLTRFASPTFRFVNFEIELVRTIREIGRQTLQEAVPYIYGNGYVGPTFRSEEGEIYSCNERAKNRWLKTVFGKISFERARYYNDDIGATRSVTDILMDIEHRKYCPLLRYWCCLLGTVAPFNEASDLLQKLTGIYVSGKDIQRITERIAKDVKEEHDLAIKDIQLNEDEQVEAAAINVNQNALKKVYLETDGCHIPTLDGWKECKTLLLFEMEIEGDKNVLFNKHYFSSLRDVKYFKRQVKAQLEAYCKEQEVDIISIGDGADWIWNMMKELVPQGTTEILDWYHVSEKIWKVANELYLEDTDLRTRFVNEQLSWLKEGNTEVVLQNLMALKNKEENILRRELIDKTLKYMDKNKERMRYDLFKKQGHCIGSGAIESANKYVIQRRLKLPGIRWKPENAEYMAHLRAEYINRKLEGFLGINTGPLLEVAET